MRELQALQPLLMHGLRLVPGILPQGQEPSHPTALVAARSFAATQPTLAPARTAALSTATAAATATAADATST